MKKTVLILGATSSITQHVAATFAKKGYSLFLASRDEYELQRISDDLHVRYQANVKYASFDAEKIETHEQFFFNVLQKCRKVDGVVLGFGDTGDRNKVKSDFHFANQVILRNYTGACSILTLVANYFEKKKEGFIIGISSVAGDCGRQGNYVYGSAKGGFSLFLQGLRNRLYQSGVHVMTVKPGFVDTPMTYGRPDVFLAACPKKVGEKIVDSFEKSKDVVYIPGWWRLVMSLFRHIPEKIFKRLKM